MILSDFFITRPRFAIVVSIVMVLLGLMAIVVLPVSQYPQITPPQIVVQASYPGASADVVVDTVAVPIENELNGVEGMLYMESTSDDSGDYQLTITFDIGTDPDIAQVKVENRLQQVNPFLPEIVRQEGLSVTTQMANILGMLVLRSPNQTHSSLFLSNYAYANIQNPLARIKGVSAVNIYGPQYSMRIWINPEKLSALGLSSDDVVKAVKTQNIQASIGNIGSAPNNEQTGVVLSLTAKGLLKTPEDFDNIILKTNAQGGLIRLKDVAKLNSVPTHIIFQRLMTMHRLLLSVFRRRRGQILYLSWKTSKKKLKHYRMLFRKIWSLKSPMIQQHLSAPLLKVSFQLFLLLFC